MAGGSKPPARKREREDFDPEDKSAVHETVARGLAVCCTIIFVGLGVFWLNGVATEVGLEPVLQATPDVWTADEMVDYFRVHTPAQLRFAFGVDTKERLKEVLNDRKHHIISVPISHASVEHHGTQRAGLHAREAWTKPVIGHSPDHNSSFTFTEFLDIWMDSGTHQGLEIEFRDPRVVSKVLLALKVEVEYNRIKGPVILSADVLPGPGGMPVPMQQTTMDLPHSGVFREVMDEVRRYGIMTTQDFSGSTSYRVEFDPAGFIRAAAKNLPGSFLQLGWSTTDDCLTRLPIPAKNPYQLNGRKLLGRAAARALLRKKGGGGKPAPPPVYTQKMADEMQRQVFLGWGDRKGPRPGGAQRWVFRGGCLGSAALNPEEDRAGTARSRLTRSVSRPAAQSLLDLVDWQSGYALKIKACLLPHSQEFVTHYTRDKSMMNTTFLLYGPVSQPVASWVRDTFDAARTMLNLTTVDNLPI